MKPRSYFLLGVVSGAAVLIVGWATRTNDCLQTSPSWAAWFDFIVGAFSIAAIFASIIAWGRAQGRQGISIVLIVQATLGAGIWGVVGFITLFMIVVPNGCLD